MAAIFEGVDDLIDRALGIAHIGNAPHYRHKTSALLLRSRPLGLNVPSLLDGIRNKLYQNWSLGQERRARRGSAENWRWEKKTWISNSNSSVEKQCEKAIALECGDDWVNQVPTASGLIDGKSERHCDIDLVHRCGPSAYEFIELKYEDATPLFAAFELLKYGMLYVFSHDFMMELGYTFEEKPVLAAREVHLCVLAPADYYAGFTLDWLEKELNLGLRTIGGSAYRMDFRFEKMDWPDGGDVVSALATRSRVCHWAKAASGS
ncbi:MAG TPA: hypothetical protein VFI82_00215 [Terriglobales bacterium]|nr:hypothetical protein [Terriglobales bacterium]